MKFLLGAALGAVASAVISRRGKAHSQKEATELKGEDADATFQYRRQSLQAITTMKAHQLPLDHASVRRAFISLVPKAELHVHIEGTLEPRMMLDLARRNGLPAPYPSEDAARQAYKFTDLQSFLDLYYGGCSVLRTTEDFYDLAMAYLLRAATSHVAHVEFFFDPQTHLENGTPFDVFMPGLIKASQDAKAMGVSVSMIMCFLKHLSEESAMETLKLAEPWLGHLVGVGLDSGELGNPPQKFARVMERVRELGLLTVAHAGEEGPAQYVWDSLNILQVSRVDHGVRSVEDPKLMEYLRQHKVPLTVCPLSNLHLKVYDGQLVERLRQLIAGTGLVITINSDDPAYFDGYINENYEWLAAQLNLTVSDIANMAANSFTASFIPEASKAAYVKRVRELEFAWVNIEKQVLASGDNNNNTATSIAA